MKKTLVAITIALAIVIGFIGTVIAKASNASVSYICDKSSRRAYYMVSYTIDNVPVVEETDTIRLEMRGTLRNLATNRSRNIVLTSVGNGTFAASVPMYKIGEYELSFTEIALVKYVPAITVSNEEVLLKYELETYAHESYLYVVNQ